MTSSGDVHQPADSNVLHCSACEAALAHDQRYCVECGARRGPLPRTGLGADRRAAGEGTRRAPRPGPDRPRRSPWSGGSETGGRDSAPAMLTPRTAAIAVHGDAGIRRRGRRGGGRRREPRQPRGRAAAAGRTRWRRARDGGGHCEFRRPSAGGGSSGGSAGAAATAQTITVTETAPSPKSTSTSAASSSSGNTLAATQVIPAAVPTACSGCRRSSTCS